MHTDGWTEGQSRFPPKKEEVEMGKYQRVEDREGKNLHTNLTTTYI